jgi:hypothetical protein
MKPLALAAVVLSFAASAAEANGPLRPHPQNPRWFTDDTGKAVVLTGSHTWETVQDFQRAGVPPFDWPAFLDMVAGHGHTYVRLWMWEHPERVCWSDEAVSVSPLPWKRTGPGLAADSKPKFDLDAFDPAYFERLRSRVADAQRRGVYVSVMLFQGWSLDKSGNPQGDPWFAHPMNPANNVQGIGAADGRADTDDLPTVHSLKNPALLAKQETYVRRVVDAVNGFDNVLYEVLNEGGAVDWQYHVIRLVKEYERTKPKQHPVGMSHRITGGMTNADLWRSPADWIAVAIEPQAWTHPGSTPLQDYKDDPPASDGSKVVVVDTDHLWGLGGNETWAWKSFLRGLHPAFMDPWRPLPEPSPRVAAWMTVANGIAWNRPDYPDWEPLRRAMGQVAAWSRKVDLARMTPRGDLASTRYCLADPGREYLVLAPGGGTITLDLRDAKGPLAAEWLVVRSGETLPLGTPVAGGDYVVLPAPGRGDAVLHLVRR